jgi:hypothetical protein
MLEASLAQVLKHLPSKCSNPNPPKKRKKGEAAALIFPRGYCRSFPVYPLTVLI